MIGVIGGSGLYEMEGLEQVERVRLQTPFGDPSDEFITGVLNGVPTGISAPPRPRAPLPALRGQLPGQHLRHEDRWGWNGSSRSRPWVA